MASKRDPGRSGRVKGPGLTGRAYRLDQWLHLRLGRPYAMLLNVGLVIDIVHRVSQTLHRPEGAG